ncbi:MAG: HAD family hydrolase [Sphingomonadales bacterium 35-56-22]|jgi:putative hydrolase of the HAD superfamily|uniref:HAD-IA family hydrolase n=1 Tax=Sphingorhabdus sp. TaxID=1902408 RepID=UPI000BC4B13E|nr:HAD-IA family hydrolase [Sphingorhabdus sp.]OYY16021.1 MAG: HAD family hydrolase [Sphingomonadales bacterium 35-56-22]OYY97592.1 MAG: HAD family hydrolase [Sphingomonadales bacterium 28-56-43]OYZ61108.1 MAG: HAD family hydrolase [Sphingomonadales bacterium 24-56-14]OZA82595.1 MAG: HAD family hydrolase [Sphingomonadales bacterium 39-57-19]HQS12663.1 HAD-IA family hydrolase [Sphingorhabdus sp.]
MTFNTVIFDFGGVITSSPFEAFNRMEAGRGLPKDFVRRVNSVNPDNNAWAKFERAECSANEFDALFAAEAQALGHALDGASVIACLAGEIRPDMVAALDQLKSIGFALGCITNNVPSGKGAGMAVSDAKAAAVAAVMERFDHIIESSKAGVRKPDPRIYNMMCDALAVSPPQCIYLDDLGINCKPAAAMGMAAIKVTSGAQALGELGALLALTFIPVEV